MGFWGQTAIAGTARLTSPSPMGNGLVPSQEEDYDLKSKVLGKGGNRRFHGKFIDGVLHFTGLVTEH
ncbi:hypothetical protein [Calothrix rhizosoleniae]|uniref:hypothetical protein n=1 Tax=Calothrix rhizosoleniae TaxID=888997 RepID=UPI000B49CE5D|nr:hypothetical protein [Calothrix rhizosoleniae]